MSNASPVRAPTQPLPWGVLLIGLFMLGSLGYRAWREPRPRDGDAPAPPPALVETEPSDEAMGDLLDGRPLPINRASRAALECLPGIGPGLSERILKARKAAPFRSLADLRAVRGLGSKKVAALAPFVRFD